MLDLEAIKERIEQTCEDASEFIQHAPADLDALIAEVERLRAERETISKRLCRVLIHPELGKYAPKDMDSLLAGVAELEAENKQLRSDSCVSGANAAAAWFKAIAERDEARAEAKTLRADRDRWHDAATALSVEFTKADNRAIAAADRAASMQGELQALSWIAKRIEDIADDSFQARLEDEFNDREKLIATIGELQKEVRDSRRQPFPQAGEPVLCGDDNEDAAAFFLGSVPPRFGKSQERDNG